MPLQTANWRVQQNNAASLLRSFLLAGTTISGLCITLINSNQYNEYTMLFGLVIFISAFLPLSFAKKYLNHKKSEHFIILSSKSLIIPTSMMKERTIDLSKIKSLETLHYFTKTKGLLIGLTDGSSEFIDARSFESSASFDDFKQKLTGYAAQESTGTSKSSAKALHVKPIKNNHKTTTCISIAILTAYVITTAPGLGEITENSIEIGALTKPVLMFLEPYRITSSFFLHLNFNHLIINITCLSIVGKNINTLLGKFRFSEILFGSALIGSLFSLNYSEAKYVIGASGGIMGLLGTYSVVCFKYQNFIPGSVSTSTKKIVLVLFLQTVSDITSKGADIFSHAGGFLFGVAFGVLLLNGSQPTRISDSSRLEAIIAVSLFSLYFAGLFFFIFTYLSTSFFEMP